MALAIARAPERRRNALLLALMLPFWTGFLMRINAWIGLLQDDGWINAALVFCHLSPVRLLYTDNGDVYRHRLHLPAVHGAAALCAADAAGPGIAGGRGRSRRPAAGARSCR